MYIIFFVIIIFFNKIAANNLYGRRDNLRIVLEKDLEMEFEEGIWEALVSGMRGPVRDIRSKLIHYKIIIRYYWTPVRLHKLGLIQNNHCWKYGNSVGTFLHLMCSCHLVALFWTRVIQNIKEWLGQLYFILQDVVFLVI